MKSNFDLYPAIHWLTIWPENRFHFPGYDLFHRLFFESIPRTFDDSRIFNFAIRRNRHIKQNRACNLGFAGGLRKFWCRTTNTLWRSYPL